MQGILNQFCQHQESSTSSLQKEGGWRGQRERISLEGGIELLWHFPFPSPMKDSGVRAFFSQPKRGGLRVWLGSAVSLPPGFLCLHMVEGGE